MAIIFTLPDLPRGSLPARLVCWLKRPGEPLAQGDPLLVVVNDRAEFALPAPVAGELESQMLAEGASLDAGAALAHIRAVHPLAPAAAPARPPRVSPLARRVAAASGIALDGLIGSGVGGRIMKRDVLAATAPQPQLEPAPLAPPSPMRQAIATHMLRSRASAAHALTAMEVDLAQVAAARAQASAQPSPQHHTPTYTAYFALAAVAALRRHPLLNSSWHSAGIIVRRRIHLAIAVALPHGLLAPIIRDAQDLNISGMARSLGQLVRRARAGQLEPGETSGGTFTLSNAGAGALWFGAPIIAQPQSATLGIGAIRPRPVVLADRAVERIAIRPTALLTLSYDARVLDQRQADAFLCDMKHIIETWAQ